MPRSSGGDKAAIVFDQKPPKCSETSHGKTTKIMKTIRSQNCQNVEKCQKLLKYLGLLQTNMHSTKELPTSSRL